MGYLFGNRKYVDHSLFCLSINPICMYSSLDTYLYLYLVLDVPTMVVVGGAVDGTVVVGGVAETQHIVAVVGVLGILDLVLEQPLVLEEHLVVNYTKTHPFKLNYIIHVDTI